MRKKISTALLSSLVFGLSCAQSMVDEQTIDQSSKPVVVAKSDEAQSFNDWVAEKELALGQRQGISKGGTTVFAGSAPVRVPPSDPDYGKELAIAYERALFDLQADYILSVYGRLVSKTVLDVYRDASTNKDEFPAIQPGDEEKPGRIAQILDKTLTLMDKRLDNELIKQGVDPAKVNSMTLTQKKKTFEDSISKQVVRDAFGQMRGLVPYQTRIFSKQNANGVSTIVGIVAVQSQKTQQFAKDISLERDSLVRGKAKQLTDLLPEDNKGYLEQIGLRYAYDEKGHPMLISFGRWSLNENKNWSPARYEREMQLAQGTAEALAQSWIVEFTKFRVDVSQSDDTGSLQQEIAKQISTISSEGTSNERVREDISGAIDKVFKKGRGSASGKLAGMSVVKRWEQRDANGVMHVGSVVTWTQGQLDSTKPGGRKQSARDQHKKSIPEERSSRIVNSKDDF